MSVSVMNNGGSSGETHITIDGVEQTGDLDFVTTNLSAYPYSSSSTIPSVFSFNNEIHILIYENSSRKHFAFDGVNWREFSSLPAVTGLYSSSWYGAIYNNEIYIFACYGTTKYFYKWDGKSWVSLSTPSNSYSLSLKGIVGCSNGIYLFLLSSATSRLYVYLWDGEGWNSVTSTGNSANWYYFGTAVAYNDKPYLLGSSDNNSGHYRMFYEFSDTTASSKGTLPYPTGGSIEFDSNLYITGSTHSSFTTYSRSFYKWDGSSWTSVNTAPIAKRYIVGLGIINNHLYLIGTNDSSISNSQKVYRLSDDMTSWEEISNNYYSLQS